MKILKRYNKLWIFVVMLFIFGTSFGQNLLVNGDFETGNLMGWGGYANQVVTDDITNSKSGNNNNGDASTFQVFNPLENATYKVTFDYRWVSGTGAYTMNVVVKDGATGGANLGLLALNSTPDIWHKGTFTFKVPVGVTQARIIFYKPAGMRPLRMDNVSIVLEPTSKVLDLSEFDFTIGPNPAENFLKLMATNSIKKVEIYSASGQQMKLSLINNSINEVDISSLLKGVYFLRAYIDDSVGTYKFTKL